jgi:hypothetical protein
MTVQPQAPVRQVPPRTTSQPQAPVVEPQPAPQPAPAPAPPPPEPEKPTELPSEVTVQLGRPIKSHLSPTTTSLTFREPTALDIDNVGNPVSMNFSRGWPPLPEVDAKKMTAMLARLANVAPSSILQMTARDWSTCSLAVQIFFLPDLGNL